MVAVIGPGAATGAAVHDPCSFGSVIDAQSLQIAMIDSAYAERDRWAGRPVGTATWPRDAIAQ